MRQITVALVQMACSAEREENWTRAAEFVRDAKSNGADLVLLPELFEGRYFPQSQDAAAFQRAAPIESHPTLAYMTHLARELDVILPVSIFERANQAHYNAVVTIGRNGEQLGHYRKSHIPDGPGYQEKFYFNPGDTGFRTIDCGDFRIGVGICWDQWFPEAARAMALKGAEILLYPTAIGSEPQDPSLDSRHHWRRVMQGHAAANVMPVLAANRVGHEPGSLGTALDFYGHSFITDETGAIVAGLDTEDGAILLQRFDLDAIAEARRAWGLFRDRRCDLYEPLLRLDGGS